METKTTCTQGITQVCISHYVQHLAHHQWWLQVAKLVTPLTLASQRFSEGAKTIIINRLNLVYRAYGDASATIMNHDMHALVLKVDLCV